MLIVNENSDALETEADKLLGEAKRIYNKMVILKKTKILTGLGMVVLLLLSFGVYGMYKAKGALVKVPASQ